MIAQVYSLGLRGATGYPVLVELDLAGGLPAFATVGLPDSAVRESRERVSSAVRNSGFRVPQRRITVNLAPAQSRKQGTQFDLAIAMAMLSASGQVADGDWRRRFGFIGELALDGTLRPVPGALAMALRAKAEGFEALVVPAANGAEAAAAGLPVHAASSLRAVTELLGAPAGLSSTLAPGAGSASLSLASEAELDLADVRGQSAARRALEIAAAGGHNLLLIGSPGVGKTMLARRLPGLLPPMTREEAAQVASVHTVLSPAEGLPKRRPFRSPHHTSSHTSLVGGGPSARPGEVSLAHGGVLFLDELAEFPRPALESLREPLESHKVVIARARETVEYPARFMLAAATNPCPCGWRGHPSRECSCTPPAVQRYLARLSGPLLDRIDLHVELAPVAYDEWSGKAGEASAVVRERVVAARRRQAGRLAGRPFADNAAMTPSEARAHCALDARCHEVLEAASAKYALSARSLDRCVRVARTIADLAGAERIGPAHLKEALSFRGLDRLREGGRL